MTEYIIENLPDLFRASVYSIARVRQDAQNGVLDRVETPIMDMMVTHDIENNQNIESAREMPYSVPRNSANLESLYDFVMVVDSDMRFAMHPPFNGKIRHDTMIRGRLEKYYKTSIKKYARTFKIYFDGLIKYDGFNAEQFDDYQRLAKLVENTNGDIADEYLLKLSTIAKQLIPANYHTENSYVVDSNSVDINKVGD